MENERRVRIVDIAEALGLSTATVSNVIHGKTKKISGRTVAAVQRELEERGYIPNMAATLLAQNDSRIIGIIVNAHAKYEGHVFEDPFIASSVNALSLEIERSGYFMMLKQTAEITAVERFASMWNLDGMVLIGFCEEDYHTLRNRIRIPFVVYDGFFNNRGRICNLKIDDFDGGRQVGVLFRNLHFTNVACLSDNDVCMDYARYRGLCDGFGADVPLILIPMQKEKRLAFYANRFDELMSYQAFFVVSDYYAIEWMRFLLSHGIRVPGDIAVTGFDGIPLSEQITPQLTTVRQDNTRRAKEALLLLQKMKTDPAFYTDVTLPVELIVRESTPSAG